MPKPPTDPVLFDLLHCCTSMQQFAQQLLLGGPACGCSNALRGSLPGDGGGGSPAAAALEAAGVRLVSTAMSAMAVLAVMAVPAVAAAAAAGHAAALRAASAEQAERPTDERPFDLVPEIMSALLTLWQSAPLFGGLLPEVVEVGHLSHPRHDMPLCAMSLCVFTFKSVSHSQTRHSALIQNHVPPSRAIQYLAAQRQPLL